MPCHQQDNSVRRITAKSSVRIACTQHHIRNPLPQEDTLMFSEVSLFLLLTHMIITCTQHHIRNPLPGGGGVDTLVFLEVSLYLLVTHMIIACTQHDVRNPLPGEDTLVFPEVSLYLLVTHMCVVKYIYKTIKFLNDNTTQRNEYFLRFCVEILH